MTISIAQFRADYPEFGSNVSYPDAQINYWLGVAYSMLNAARWGRQLDMAAELYTAHNIALEFKAQADSAAGAMPGESTGVVSAKSVDSVSKSYDTTIASQEGAGHWNLTIYGTRLYRLIRLFGAGPMQLGVGAAPEYSGMGWAGPLVVPGFTNFGN